MSSFPAAPPPTLDTPTIVDHYDLTFDAGEKANGSLYVCTPRGAAAPDTIVAALRKAALWSAEPAKVVGDEQRPAYRDGLQYVAAVAYRDADGHVLLARFDHPKFPSDAARWDAWLACLDADHERL
ncbi:MAG: hypothetical protein RLW61_13240 [Gammaproteobacteria bacterium]